MDLQQLFTPLSSFDINVLLVGLNNECTWIAPPTKSKAHPLIASFDLRQGLLHQLISYQTTLLLDPRQEESYAGLLLQSGEAILIGPSHKPKKPQIDLEQIGGISELSQYNLALREHELRCQAVNAILTTIAHMVNHTNEVHLHGSKDSTDSIESTENTESKEATTQIKPASFISDEDQAHDEVLAILDEFKDKEGSVLGSKSEQVQKVWPMEMPHNTFAYEMNLLQAITDGDPERTARALKKPMHGQEGRMGFNELRHSQNSAIIIATLCARAAMRGGVKATTAYSMADYIILRSELSTSVEEAELLRNECTWCFARLVQMGKNKAYAQHSLLVQKLLAEIERVLFSPVKRDGIVSCLERNSDYVERIFKKEMGLSIMAYLRMRRIRVAANLLLSSNRKLGELASLLQFSSTSHFSRVFRQVMGLSPLEYQKRYAQESVAITIK